ncbi:MAG: DUF4221 family protein, partial [Haliscomenobacter sp.]|nr:DUF4221 family protein [Haliscomenobacter sp.]
MKNLPIWYQGVFPMVCSFFLCVSCTPDEKELDYQLSYSHTIAFPLDYESGAFPSFARLDRINGREIFGFFNNGNNQLYLYDAQTQKLVKQIAFEKEGPNGIGSSQVIGYQYLSPDSIFLFTYNLMKLFHVNESGKV